MNQDINIGMLKYFQIIKRDKKTTLHFDFKNTQSLYQIFVTSLWFMVIISYFLVIPIIFIMVCFITDNFPKIFANYSYRGTQFFQMIMIQMIPQRLKIFNSLPSNVPRLSF